jgi:GNAT superfamily N-acetyltransferase
MRSTGMADVTALLAAYDEQVRTAEVTHLPPGVRTERDGPIARVIGQYRGFISAPADLGLDGDEVDALIARQREFFARRGKAVEWKTRAHDRPADLTDRLRRAGFRPEPLETVLIGLVEQLAGLPAPSVPEVSIRLTDAPRDMERIAAMESEIWHEDWSWLAAELIGRAQAGQFAVFVAEADGQVVSSAWLVFMPGTEFAGLWGGATRPGWRGKGIYRALIGRRAELAAQRGLRYLQVDASDDSRPVLERLGFIVVTTATPYVWTPATPGPDA